MRAKQAVEMYSILSGLFAACPTYGLPISGPDEPDSIIVGKTQQGRGRSLALVLIRYAS